MLSTDLSLPCVYFLGGYTILYYYGPLCPPFLHLNTWILQSSILLLIFLISTHRPCLSSEGEWVSHRGSSEERPKSDGIIIFKLSSLDCWDSTVFWTIISGHGAVKHPLAEAEFIVTLTISKARVTFAQFTITVSTAWVGVAVEHHLKTVWSWCRPP